MEIPLPNGSGYQPTIAELLIKPSVRQFVTNFVPILVVPIQIIDSDELLKLKFEVWVLCG